MRREKKTLMDDSLKRSREDCSKRSKFDVNVYLNKVEDSIRCVLNTTGFASLVFSPEVIADLKALSHDEVKSFIVQRKPQNIYEEKMIRKDFLFEHHKSLAEIWPLCDPTLNCEQRDNSELCSWANDYKCYDIEEIVDAGSSIWPILWNLFDNNVKMEHSLSQYDCLHYLIRLWMADTAQFILYALLMLHHCEHKNNINETPDFVSNWPASMVSILLLPFELNSKVRDRPGIFHTIVSSTGKPDLAHVHRIEYKIYDRPSLLDTFYMRFNGCSFDHVKKSFGFNYNPDGCTVTKPI